jgi:hypothetical protein
MVKKTEAHAEDACASVWDLRDSRLLSMALAPSVSAPADKFPGLSETFQRFARNRVLLPESFTWQKAICQTCPFGARVNIRVSPLLPIDHKDLVDLIS